MLWHCSNSKPVPRDANRQHVHATCRAAPLRSEVDAADAQVVSRSDEARVQFQGSAVRLHGLREETT